MSVMHLNKIDNLIEASKQISVLVQDLQKEREYSIEYYNSNGSSFKNELLAKRASVDRELSELKDILRGVEYNSELSESYDEAFNKLDILRTTRKEIIDLDSDESLIVEDYSNIIASYLSILIKISNFSSDPEVSQRVIAMYNFLKYEEYSKLEKSVGASILKKNYFEDESRGLISELISSQKSFEKLFRDFSDKKDEQIFDKAMAKKELKEIEVLRYKILMTTNIGGFRVDPTYWFDTITKKLNLYKKTEDYIVANLRISSEELKRKVEVAVAASNLLHETQKERGASAGYLGSRGKKFKNRLAKQRLLTNKRLQILKSRYAEIDKSTMNGEMKRILNRVLGKLKKLESVRDRVDIFKIETKDAIKYYTSMNSELLDFVASIAKDGRNVNEARDLFAWYYFIMAKERGGIERAVLSNSFARSSFLPGMKEKFVKLVTEQNDYINSFKKIANLRYRNYFNSTVKGKYVDEVERMRKIAMEAKNIGGFNIDPNYWKNLMDFKISILSQFDKYLMNKLVDLVNSKLSSLYAYTAILIASIFIINIFVFMLGGAILKNIISSIDNFKEKLLDFFRYLNGDSNSVHKLDETNDEIGEMAKVVNQNIEKVSKNIEEERKVVNTTIETLKEIEQGDFSHRIMVSTTNKGLQSLVDLINNMSQNLENNINNILEIIRQYSDNNFKNKIDTNELKGHIYMLASGFNTLHDKITTILEMNKKEGDKLKGNSVVLLKNVDELNVQTKQSATALVQTAASIEEVKKSIEINSETAGELAKNTDEIKVVAENGKLYVNETDAAMHNISEDITAIADAVSTIEQIAFQTNILSLNAAVEAATAGEAGKGFAVVASEVRNLANRSAKSAKDIKDLIEKAIERSHEGKEVTNHMMQGYEKLSEILDKTIDKIVSVSSITKEQKDAILQINHAIELLEKQIKGNVEIVDSTKDVANKNDDIADEIVKEANKYNY